MKFEHISDSIIYVKDGSYNKLYDFDGLNKDTNNILYFKGYLVHRENGPAVENKDYECWLINGKYHREDGPAVQWFDGHKSYYLNDIFYSEENYQKIINIKKKQQILENII